MCFLLCVADWWRRSILRLVLRRESLSYMFLFDSSFTSVTSRHFWLVPLWCYEDEPQFCIDTTYATLKQHENLGTQEANGAY